MFPNQIALNIEIHLKTEQQYYEFLFGLSVYVINARLCLRPVTHGDAQQRSVAITRLYRDRITAAATASQLFR